MVQKIYTPQMIEKVMFMREKCGMMPSAIAEEMSVTLGQPIHRRTISEITTNYGVIGADKPIKAPHFDGWWFGDDNIELPRGA